MGRKYRARVISAYGNKPDPRQTTNPFLLLICLLATFGAVWRRLALPGRLDNDKDDDDDNDNDDNGGGPPTID